MTKVIVAGGGVGGLTTAIALRQAGLEVELYEQADALRPIGAGLHIWTNAVRVLQGLGVADKLAEHSTEMQRAEFRTASGGLLASWPIVEISRELGAPTLQVSREELSIVLASFVDDSAIHLSRKVTGFEESAEGVEVRFADGATEHADVLVGADGLRSAVRAQILGDQPPREAGYTVWRGVLEGASRMVKPGTFNSLFGRGERFVFYDLGFDVLYWMSVAPNEGAVETRGEALKDILRERHKGWMDPIPDMIAATDPGEIHRTVIYDRAPDERWSSQRATLLGDAAHPMTFNVGQGACQAMEDAVVLARHLSSGAAVPAALHAYEQDRKPRTAKFQNLATRLGNMGQWSNPVRVMMRNNVMRVIYRTVALKEHKKDMAWVDTPSREPV
jgi:2-polyprenyl-6-methoxyphenol hydroxylase-like FAD-dependent oxidoreductase